MYTLSTWYTKDETTQHIAVFFLGMFGGTAISPLLASALMKLEGKRGLWGWQWIFLGMILWVLGLQFFLIPHSRRALIHNSLNHVACLSARKKQQPSECCSSWKQYGWRKADNRNNNTVQCSHIPLAVVLYLETIGEASFQIAKLQGIYRFSWAVASLFESLREDPDQ